MVNCSTNIMGVTNTCFLIGVKAYSHRACKYGQEPQVGKFTGPSHETTTIILLSGQRVSDCSLNLDLCTHRLGRLSEFIRGVSLCGGRCRKPQPAKGQRASVSGVLDHEGSIIFIRLHQGSGTVPKTVRRTGVDR